MRVDIKDGTTPMSNGNSSWISDWDPEDETYWTTKGSAIARRNLIWSIIAEHLGFSIWLIWSIVATKLPQAGFTYTTDQLFQLVALPGLIGSLMRFPYTFAVTTFGGRNWTIISASILFIPTIALAYFVTQPDTPFWLMLCVAATAGIESGAALGFIGAIGACGGYLIPSGFGKSIALTGGPQLALVVYLVFYATCLALTWWYYLRRSSDASGVPSLAEARI